MASGISKGLSYGAGGAAAGSVLGPWGAAIGGAGGLLAGLFSGDDSTAPQDAATAAGQDKIRRMEAASAALQDQRSKMAQIQMQQLQNRMANYQGANNVLASMYGGGGQGGRGPSSIPTQQNQASMGSISQGPAISKLAQLMPAQVPTQQNQNAMGSIGQGPATGRLQPGPSQMAPPQISPIANGPSPALGQLLTPDTLNAAAQRAALGSIMGGPQPLHPVAPSAIAQSGILQRLGGLNGIGAGGMAGGIGRFG